MENKLKFDRAVFLLSLVLLGSAAQAQPTPNAPSLPPPTEEQLQKGRALLDKIMDIVKNVPLSKPSEVFRLFGLGQVELYPQKHPQSEKFPDLTLVQITSYDKAVREKWREIGIRSIDIKYPFDKVKDADRMGMGFIRDQACVSYDDVRRMFWPISTQVSNPKLAGGITTSPVPVSPPVHEYNSMVIGLERIHASYRILLNFNFEYQTCANGVGIRNILNITKETQR